MQSMSKTISCFVALIFFLGCGQKEGSLFSNPEPSETGLTFSNILTPADNANILDYLYFYNGGGVAVGDVNGDELPDIFFSGNQVKNKLYLNQGDLKFQDVTDFAGVAGKSSWNTGVVMGDVNGDGLLDIYVCAVVGINGFNGHNELYINNGTDKSGNVSFTESAAQFGLDFDSYSSSAAFLDFDLDGDLDIYLLNHAVHTQESYGLSEIRKKRNYQTGDKLLRNDNGKFVDISEQAGIYGGVNGYGLGIAISDFNQDGFPDIFVGNDFHEDDYYYLNNGDGTFTESFKTYFGLSSRFSMGNDVTDINNDGWPDIISLDMLPEDETILKSSEGSDDMQTQRLRTERFGYHYQYSRNMLFINRQNKSYKEVALQSGIAATDWSWSALFADYNQDGKQDLFISNGITKRPNDLDYINFLSSDQIKKKINSTKLVDDEAIKLMPSGAIPNYIFKGADELLFEDMSGKWITNDTIISGATALADFDLDGDLDLITNNSDAPATLYLNKTDNNSNHLKIRFNYKDGNKLGIGTKVFSYHNKGVLQYKELYTVRGFQASSEPIIHFGYGEIEKVDSLRVVWPDKTSQIFKQIKVNQTLTIKPENNTEFSYDRFKLKVKPLFEKIPNSLGIDFTHKEDNYIDFNRQKLMPYQIGDRGPANAIGDLNEDGRDDIFFGGSKYIPSKVFIQKDSGFVETKILEILKDSIKEDITASIADFNGDNKNDILIGSGGGDFFNEMKPLLDSYYQKNNTSYRTMNLGEHYHNASVIKPNDYDNDGDLDVFIGSQAITNDFGKIPISLLLNNKEGAFSSITNTALENVGMITDAVWSDFDNDGTKDLIIVGEWMSPKFFKNNQGILEEVDLLEDKLNGLWQSLVPFDIDNDGDLDYLLGNWGNNTKFRASDKFPLKMYYSDFDGNGSTETVITQEKNGRYYPIDDFNSLSSQMVSLRKKFSTYKDFAGKTIEQIFSENQLENAKILSINELKSGYLENNEGKFSFKPFQQELQVAPIMTFLAYDFDGDDKNEILAAGNYFGVKPYHGRFGSFSGALIKNENDVILGYQLGLDFINKSARNLAIVTVSKQAYLLATFNNDSAQVYYLKTNYEK
jgi:hypothetical protein